jgi:hypothetical protein
MPFTPFHLGPGLLLKAAVPRHLSFVSFAATQLTIDLESWYHLTNGDPHVHRILHTFLWGGVAGVAIGGLLFVLGSAVHRLLRGRAATLSIGAERPVFGPEVSLLGATLGGLLGGLTHALLDGVMHTDIQPFRPFSLGNPLLGVLPLGFLHKACVVAGILGAGGLVLNSRLWPGTPRR